MCDLNRIGAGGGAALAVARAPGVRGEPVGPAPRRSRGSRGLLAGLALVAAQGCSEPEETNGISLQTAPAELRPMRITAEADGQLEPVLKVEVKSKASGEILELFVDSGDEVEPGTLLARIDPRDVENAWKQALADLAVAVEREKIAEAQLTRNRRLLEEEVITTQEFESRELEYANAQASLVRAETNRDLARLRLADVTIKAPMAGTILEKLVEYGQVIQSATQNVSGGTTLFIMANLDDMRVRTLVDETDVGKLAAGLPATVSVEAFPDRTFRGHIEKIEPQAIAQQNVTMFPVIVLLDNRAGLLKPGMNAEVEVLVDERAETVAVPNNAIVQPQEMAAAAEVLGLEAESLSFDYRAYGPLMAQAATRFAELGSEGAPAPGMTGGGFRGGRGGAPAGAMGDGMARESAGGGENASGEEPGAAAGAVSAGANGRLTIAQVREMVQSGEITQDSARALWAAMRSRRSGPGRPGSVGAEHSAEETDGSAGQSAEDPDGDGEQTAEAGGGNTAVGGEGRQGPRMGGERGGRPGDGAGGFGGGGFRGGMMAAMGGSTGDPAYRPAVVFVVDEAGDIEPRAVVIGLSDWDYVEILAGLEAGEELALIGAAQLQARQQERLERMRQRMRPF